MQIDVPVKPRRKKLDVPVHRSDASLHKTFAANHPTKSTKKIHKDDAQSLPSTEEKTNARISKKHLVKENEMLKEENLEIHEKLSSMDAYLNRKTSRLKEKLNALQKINEEIVNENNTIKTRYQEIVAELNAVKKELTASKRCQNCQDLTKALETTRNECLVLKKANAELLEDENMLKNVIYRLNVQLELNQEKLHKRKTKPDSSTCDNPRPETVDHFSSENNLPEDHRNHPHVPISWGSVNAHTLAPLLDAYQGTIAEKEEIIRGYETELSSFTERLKAIVKENESLHKKLNEDDERAGNVAAEAENLRRELKSVRDQNDLLIKKCAVKQDKVEEILKCYEQKVDELRRDYKVLHEEYCKCRTEIAGLRERNKSLVDVRDEFKTERQQYIPISVHAASVNECKKWYEELKQQYENEKTKLKENVTRLTSEVNDLSKKIAQTKNEKAELEDKIKLSEKQIKKNESKFLGLQQTLDEAQLSRSVLRKQLRKAMEFAKELVKEQESLLTALNHRRQENKAVKKLGTDIANRMATLRTQLKTVQKEAFQELSGVELRLQEQDTLVASLREEHTREIDRLKQIIKDKEERNVLFKANTSIPIPHYLLFRDKTLYEYQ